MGIPLGPLREALAVARMAGPGVAKATKKTIRVLHNEGNIDSLTGMLKGKFDYNVRATMDDMMYPSSRTSAGYADDGYSAASMAKLPKGTVTNRAGSGAMRARVMGLARNAELGAMASSGKAAHAKKAGSWPVATYGSLPSHSKAPSNIGKVVKAVKTKDAATKSAAFAKRRAILNNMKNRK